MSFTCLGLKLNDNTWIPVLTPVTVVTVGNHDFIFDNWTNLNLAKWFPAEDIVCSNGDKFEYINDVRYNSATNPGGYTIMREYSFHISGVTTPREFKILLEDVNFYADYETNDSNKGVNIGGVNAGSTTTKFSAVNVRKKFWGYPWTSSSTAGTVNGAWNIDFSSPLPVEEHTFKDTNLPPQDIGGSSGVGGNDGTLDDDSDVIPIPDLPNVSLCASGFIDMYVMSNVNLVQLNDALWSSTGELVENLKKIFLDDPINGILSLALVPLNLVGVEKNVKIGNYDLGFTALRVNSEWEQLSCGTIHIAPYWGNSLDYSPFCKCQIYLPFCGTYEINVDDIMDKDIEVIYQCNVFNGACTAFITCDGSVKYSYSGNIVAQVPVSGKNSAELYKSIVGAISGVAIGSMGGMSGIALTGKAVSSGLSVLGNKGTIQRGGNVTGVNGMLAVKYPYLIFTRANQSRPDKFSSFKGYTSNITGIIAENSGYTEVAYCHVEIAGALEEDVREIENILKSGFII